MKTVFKRLAGFTGFPLLSLIAPFLILPIISRTVGDAGWANYAAGQSIGVLAAIGVLFGWGVLGPVRIATTADEGERQNIYRESLHTRLTTFMVFGPAAVIITLVITSESFQLEAVLMAISGVLVGLSPNWFCIGIGKPVLMGIYDAIPRIIVSFAAIPFIWITGLVWIYPVVLILVSLGSVILFSRMILRGSEKKRYSVSRTAESLRYLLPTALIDFTGNSYGSTPVPIATASLAAPDASTFSSAEKLYRIAIMSVAALGDAFQGWVLEPNVVNRLKRHLAAIYSHAALGLVGGAAIALLAPWVTGLVFGENVAATHAQSIFFGASLFFISATTPLIRNIMIPAGKFRRVFGATAVAAMFGLAMMITLGIAGSSAGIAAGLALSECLIFAVLLPQAIVQMRLGDSAHSEAPAGQQAAGEEATGE
ncbi:PST family polysaccharide transporter [Leucobacter exalbidus]|uniref:PST family polysaccharide transporter n=1 Tax=Leucobacter exalbidus TaxID=662960 RepID=A0A940T4S7_9MICO|nr:polysaccharide biosynthesis protein [Leucobacter exalbidus]MBP1325261.1 PST family polysaccharide transporter [Leucobacter exalbidus]